MLPPLFTLEDLDLVPAKEPLRQTYSSNTSGVLSYRGCGTPGTICHLDVYEGPDALVAIATEIPQNKGCSITTGSETVALAIEKALGLPHVFGPVQHGSKQYVMIEHYTDSSYPNRNLGEDFSLVRFHDASNSRDYYSAREWMPLAKSELERLIGGPLA